MRRITSIVLAVALACAAVALQAAHWTYTRAYGPFVKNGRIGHTVTEPRCFEPGMPRRGAYVFDVPREAVAGARLTNDRPGAEPHRQGHEEPPRQPERRHRQQRSAERSVTPSGGPARLGGFGGWYGGHRTAC
jgi:hypothetical protein